MADPRILVSWYTRPSYIQPFRLSERQVTIGPSYGDPGEGEVFRAFTPFHRSYDLGAFAASEGIGTDFDALVVWADASGNNMPTGLGAFRCPKLLCVGDTHHMNEPISTMVGYAKEAGYDYVVSSHNRHHLHWFASAGIANLAWIPGLKVRHLPQPPQPRIAGIGFVGNAADAHPWRRTQLDALRDSGLQLAAGTAPREEAARLYGQSLLGFNCSLNGDLNLRVFEILSGGACLLTDRLAPQSGLSLLLQENRHYVGYDDAEELVNKARYYLRHHDAALKIGAAGAAHFAAELAPAHQQRRLLEWLFSGKLDTQYGVGWDERPALAARDGVGLEQRIRLYEALQEAHRVQKRIRVLFGPEVPACHLADAADLKRTTMAALAPSPARGTIEQLDAGAARARSWDFVVLGKNDSAGLAEAFPGAVVLRA